MKEHCLRSCQKKKKKKVSAMCAMNLDFYHNNGFDHFGKAIHCIESNEFIEKGIKV
jgi:hypothetical protein